MEEIVQSSNINAKWLENIYENIRKIEEHERLSREGCASLLDYIQIPASQRQVVIGEAQYQNLRFMVTEMSLLLSDVDPTIKPDKANEFRETLHKLEDSLNSQHIFIKRVYNSSRELVNIKLTPFFYTTLRFISQLKIEIFREISSLLYINTNKPW